MRSIFIFYIIMHLGDIINGFIIKRVKNQHLKYILSFKTVKNKTFIFNKFFSKASHKRLLKKVLPNIMF